MGNPFKKPKAPAPPPKAPEPPPPAPLPDTAQLETVGKRKAAKRAKGSGRLSTILSGGSESLG